MLKINFKGHNLAYYKSGNEKKTPVVLLHGFCEDSRMWDEWLPLLSSYHSYLRIDLPGFGNSEVIEENSIEFMADSVAAVLKKEKIQQCVLIGHSMGGYVACAFAEKHGDLLAGLSLFHSHPFADSEEKKEGRLKAVDFIQRNGHILYVRQLIPKLFDYDYSKGYQAEVNRLIYFAAQYPPAAIIAALHAMRMRPDRSEVLKNIKCPVQFIIGQNDTAIPPELSLAQTHLPDIADIQILKNVGHMGMFKAPRKTAKAFKIFLNNIDNTL